MSFCQKKKFVFFFRLCFDAVVTGLPVATADASAAVAANGFVQTLSKRKLSKPVSASSLKLERRSEREREETDIG